MAQAKRRSRKRARRAREPGQPRLSSEQKNELARAELEPLAEGERPTAVTVAAIVVAVLGTVNAMFFVFGVEINGEEPKAGVLAYSGLMFIAAYGLWNSRYWAVLGMQAILALTIVFFFVLLMKASNLLAVVVSVAVIAAAGTLFTYLVKALARIQMPER